MTLRQQVEKTLRKSGIKPATHLMTRAPEPLNRVEIEQLEDLVLSSESRGARLDSLIDELHRWIGEVYPDLKSMLVTRVIYTPPRYTNVLADGFVDADKICGDARAVLGRLRSKKGAGEPARPLAEVVVSLILDLQLLDIRAVSALAESLSLGRRIVTKQWFGGVPVSLSSGKGTDRVERLLIASGGIMDVIRRLVGGPTELAYLERLARACAQDPKSAVKEVENQCAAVGGTGFRLKSLIDAACQMAILRMPTSVLGVRTSVVRSHALQLETVNRIGRFRPSAVLFSRPRDEEAKDEDQDVPDQTDDHVWPWLDELHKLVRKDALDLPGLEGLLKWDDLCGSTMAGYARFLSGKKQYEESTIHKYVFLIANRLMLRVAGLRESGTQDWEALLAHQIAWEELIEQVLDDDAYHNRRRYSRPLKGGSGQAEDDTPGISVTEDADSGSRPDPNRDAAGYSRALLRALACFVEFLNLGKDASEELNVMLPRAGMIAVEATMITVDEFRQALDWFESWHFNQHLDHLRRTARVALILAFRCGLRRAEIAYLRVSDFDRRIAGEDLKTAGLRLHVRPWLLRMLKTSNALRDLPLSLLIPEDELRELLDWVEEVREKGGDRAMIFHREDGEKKYARPMEFERIVQALEEAFRQGGKDRPFTVPDWHFHQCRHAFANIMLLRLWPQLHDAASHIFRYHPETLAWIAGTEQFRRDLFLVDGIRGSDLPAIALLMGHGASATTCEHYLHVMDWYVPNQSEVRQLNVSIPSNETTVAEKLAALFVHRPAPAADGPPAS